MKALIIAAGRGSRINELTENIPKCMIKLNGTPIIDLIINNIIQYEINDIVIVVGYKKEIIIDYLPKRFPTVNFDFVENKLWNNRGNGISVLSAMPAISVTEEFILLMSDHIFESSIIGLLKPFSLKSDEACLVIDKKIKEVFDIDDATKVFLNKTNILKIHKKLDTYNAVDCGIFKCNHYLFNALQKSISQGDESLSGGINKIIEEGNMRYCDIGSAYWQDIDHYEGYLKAKEFLNK